MIPTLTDPMGVSFAGRQLQYIESTGTQYIDTGVKPDYAGGDSTYISFYRANYTGSLPGIFGCRESVTSNGFAATPNGLYSYGANSGTVIGWPSTVGDYTMVVDDSDITINGAVFAAMPQRVTCTKPMYLFANSNENGRSVIFPGMRLYDWKYYRAGTLAQHLIPVLDRSGVPCLYDAVTRTLKYNAGTGTFDYA